MRLTSRLTCAAALLSFLSVSGAWASLAPGTILRPGGLQWYVRGAFNSQRNEYFLIWADVGAGNVIRGIRLDSNANRLPAPAGTERLVSPAGVPTVTPDIAYNPNTDEYLAVWSDGRSDNGDLFAQFLNGNGDRIGASFAIFVGGGTQTLPRIEYNPVDNLYIVVWHSLTAAGGRVHRQMVSANSASPALVGSNLQMRASTRPLHPHSPQVAWNAFTDKFMVAWTMIQVINGRDSDLVEGQLFNGDGSPSTGVFTLAGQGRNPSVAANSTDGQFLVSFEEGVGAGLNAAALIVNSSGTITKPRFGISQATNIPDWNTHAAYNAVADTYLVTYVLGRACGPSPCDDVLGRKVSATGVVGTVIGVANNNYLQSHGVEDGFGSWGDLVASTRQPDFLDSYQINNDDLNVGRAVLPAPVPRFTDSALPDAFYGEFYSHTLGISGGDAPFTFSVTSGNLATLGLSLGSSTGTISGTPNQVGSFPFTFRVQDSTVPPDADQDPFDLHVRLRTPTPIAPMGPINDSTPTLSWSAINAPSAPSYTVEIDKAGVLFTTIVTSSTSTTVSPALTDGSYGFRVKASASGEISAFSSTVNFQVDTQAPNPGGALLAVAPVGFAELGSVAVASSGDYSSTYSKEKASDNNASTYWSTPGRSVLQNEFLTFDLGTSQMVSRVRIRAVDATGTTFPVDFQVQVSPDNATFTPVLALTGISSVAGEEHAFPLGSPVAARYVRLLVTKVAPRPSGLFYTQVAELKVDALGVTPQSLQISWQATGDDGAGGGPASSYLLRWAFVPIDLSNFLTVATAVPETPTVPKPPGQTESVVQGSLPDETQIFYGLRIADDAGNLSSLVTTSAYTAGIAPAQINTLTASNPTDNSVMLTWNAVGDNGLLGLVTNHDVRYSTSPITEATFNSATQVTSGLPAILPSPQQESMTIGALTHTTTYYFAVKAVDDLGNKGPISNVVMASTADLTLPAPPQNLTGTKGSINPQVIAAIAVASSGDASPDYGKHKAVDSNFTTSWSTPGRVTPQNEFLTLDVGSVKMLSRVRLRSRDVGDLFPEDYQVQVGTDGVNFSTVVSVTGATVAPNSWAAPHDFTPVNARYVRILVTKARLYSAGNQYYVQIAEVEVSEAQLVGNSVTIHFDAPGDDGLLGGPVTSYDFRYSTITPFVFSSATAVPTQPVPTAPGTPQSFAIPGLVAETRYYVAGKAIDEVPNISSLSTILTVDTPGTPPAQVSPLAAVPLDGHKIELQWTEVADDGAIGDPATKYRIWKATFPLDASNFTTATELNGLNPPLAPGQLEQVQVSGLTNETTYYFAVVVLDELDNASAPAFASATTPDDTPPAPAQSFTAVAGGFALTPVAVTASSSSGDINASYGKNLAVDGNFTTSWSTPGRNTMVEEFLTADTGTPRTLGRVRLRSRDLLGSLFPEDFVVELSSDGASFTPVASRTGVSIAANTWLDPIDFTPFANARFVRIRITKTRKYSGNNQFYAQIAELEVSEAASLLDRVTLSYQVSGDDGTSGTASLTDIRWSTGAISEGNFFSLASVAGVPAPAPSGTSQSVAASGLPLGTTVHFGIRNPRRGQQLQLSRHHLHRHRHRRHHRPGRHLRPSALLRRCRPRRHRRYRDRLVRRRQLRLRQGQGCRQQLLHLLVHSSTTHHGRGVPHRGHRRLAHPDPAAPPKPGPLRRTLPRGLRRRAQLQRHLLHARRLPNRRLSRRRHLARPHRPRLHYRSLPPHPNHQDPTVLRKQPVLRADRRNRNLRAGHSQRPPAGSVERQRRRRHLRYRGRL